MIYKLQGAFMKSIPGSAIIFMQPTDIFNCSQIFGLCNLRSHWFVHLSHLISPHLSCLLISHRIFSRLAIAKWCIVSNSLRGHLQIRPAVSEPPTESDQLWVTALHSKWRLYVISNSFWKFWKHWMYKNLKKYTMPFIIVQQNKTELSISLCII